MPDVLNRVIHILLPAFILGLGSIVILRSLTPTLATYQLIFFILGLLAILLISQLSIDLFSIHPFIWYAVTLLSLVVTEIFGVVSRGSARWLEIGGFRLQTSEFAKITFILFAVSYLVKFPLTTFKAVLLYCLLMGLPFVLIALQPDLGTAITYAIITLSTLLAAKIPLKYILGLALPLLICLPLLLPLLKPYQVARLESFLSPQQDPLGQGYNARQATIAIGSGQLIGKGLGQGTQSHLKFLPERHTDFIFASYVEELGFLGGVLLISTYLWLLSGLISLAKQFERPESKLMSLTAVGLLLSQIAINIGMNLGILPITGITLPFFSYGGSSLLSSYLLLALIINLSLRDGRRKDTFIIHEL